MKMKPVLALVASISLICACGKRSEEPAADAPPAESGTSEQAMVLPASSTSEEALTHYMAGWDAFDVGRFVDANALFEKAAETDPSFAMAHLMMAVTATSTEGFTSCLNKASETAAAASRGEQLMIEASEKGFAGDQVGQIEALQKLTELHPDSPRAWGSLGFNYFNLNNAEESRAAFAKSAQLGPSLVLPQLQLSNSYMFLEPKDYDLAEKHAMKAVELAPKEPNTHDLLGDVHRAQGKLEAAYDDYTKAAEVAPTMGSPLQQRGHVSSFLGNYDEARADYTRSAELDDARGINAGPFALVFRAYVSVHEGNLDAAVAELRDLAAEYSDSDMEGAMDLQIFALQSAVQIATHAGDAETANTVLEEVAAVMRKQADEVGTAEFRDAQEATISFMEGMLAARLGDHDAAAAKSKEFEGHVASSTNPRKLERLHEIDGMSSYYQEDYEAAVTHLSQGDHLNNMYTKYYLAMANEKAGNAAEAQGLFDEMAVWNFNGADYALTRGEVLARASD